MRDFKIKVIPFIFIFLLLIGVYFVFSAPLNQKTLYPAPKNYAPNFWFDTEERYFPCNPLDFNYDKNLQEIPAEKAKEKYDSLTTQEKLNHFTIFYHLVDDKKNNQWIYEYHLYYVFNEFTNEHYGDWERVDVYVDKNTKKSIKVIGFAHNGSKTKVILANNELNNPKTNHQRILIEKGSHASCPDGNNNGLYSRFSDISNWNSAYGIRDWSLQDKLYGQKIKWNDKRYKLLSMDELKKEYSQKHSLQKRVISKAKNLGIDLLKTFRVNKVYFFQNRHIYIAKEIAGSPPSNPWQRKEYNNPKTAQPIENPLKHIVKVFPEKFTQFTSKTRDIVEETIIKLKEIIPLTNKQKKNLLTAEIKERAVFNQSNNKKTTKTQTHKEKVSNESIISINSANSKKEENNKQENIQEENNNNQENQVKVYLLEKRIDKIKKEVFLFQEKIEEIRKEKKKEIEKEKKNIKTIKEDDNSQDSQEKKDKKEKDIQENNNQENKGDLSQKKQKKRNDCLPRSIDLNTASLQELEKLVNIGPVIAQRIIDQRKKTPFFSVDDLIKVKGIGKKILTKIKNQGCAYVYIRSNHVTFYPSTGGSGNTKQSSNNNQCLPKSIEINSASQEELLKIIGVGQTIAQRIINNRPYSSLDDLIKVKGIGEKKIEKIKNQGCAYVKDENKNNSEENEENNEENNEDENENNKSTENNNKNKEENDVLKVYPSLIQFSILENDTKSQTQTLFISNKGINSLQWQSVIKYDTPSSQGNWIKIEPSFGYILANDSINASVFLTDSVSNLLTGNYYATISLSIVQEDTNNNQGTIKEVEVELKVSENFNNQNNNSNKDNQNKEEEQQPSEEVVINEIAWMGTKASIKDEWIELYNTTNEDIDISGWSIYGAKTGKCLNFDSADGFSTTIIKANDYLLYANHQDDVKDFQGNSLVDIWDATISLNNSSPGKIVLYDSSNCQGKVIDIINQEGNKYWFFGDNKTKQTMERISPKELGSDSTNWANNNLIIRQGFDANNNPINGTPKAKNSVSTSPTEINNLDAFNDDFVSEITLNLRNSPFIIKDKLTIPENKTLNIESGVVLKFIDSWGRYAGIKVNGTLKANGTEDKKIIFTSLKDDEYAGDTNNDQDKTSPSPGDWDKIYFTSSSKDSQLNNVIIRYGGGGYGTPCSPEMAGIKIEETNVEIKNSVIESNQYRGIYLINSNSEIDNTQFLNNQVCCPTCHNQYGGYALEIEGGRPTIEKSTFKENVYGIYIKSKETYEDNQLISKTETEPIIKNNNFQNNKEAPIWLENGNPEFSGNQTTNDAINGILIKNVNGYSIKNNTTLSANLPYIIDGKIIIPENKTLNIEPGIILKFADKYSGIVVNGTLKANGTEDKKIIFTSLKDDEYAGDTNNDQDKTSPSPGDWDKIYFTSSSKDSEMKNIIIRYGGGGNSFPETGIKIEETNLDLEDSVIENNQYSGLYFISSLIDTDSFSNYPLTIIKGVSFSNNKKTINNRKQGYNLWIKGSNISVENSMFKNSVYGIYIDNGKPDLKEDTLTFGIGDESNIRCNIYNSLQGECLNVP